MEFTSSTLKVFKLTSRATIPRRATPEAAGVDLCSAYNYFIPAHSRVLVHTDLQILLPEGCYGRIAPRSGLALKKFIDIGAGVIDRDYTGNIGIVVFNFGNEHFEIQRGDRVAQLVCERIDIPTVKEVSLPPFIGIATRGASGFGSTGV